jgi:hypothetical protein
MQKKLTVMLLQPGYLPWIGFFGQIYKSDIFVVYDDAQYTKQDWRNRNRIKNSEGREAYITVPVKRSPTGTLIKDMRIAYEQDWVGKHLNMLKSNYSKAPYFSDYFGVIYDILIKKYSFILGLDMELILLFMEILGLERKVFYSSQLKTPVRGKDRLLAVCKELKATHCYNGKAGEKLYSVDEFLGNDVTLEFQDFRCPKYPQAGERFIPNLSIVDLLFNCGAQSKDIIKEGEGN